jgi:hypothetical protein
VLPHASLFEQRPYGSKVAVVVPTFEHVPAPFRLHIWQVGQLLVVQQTPSVQMPLPHWLPVEHPEPFAILETQVPGVVVLPLQ